ncbi:MAG: hypothetical protein ACK4L4_20215, partial [Gemmobacter sp.]
RARAWELETEAAAERAEAAAKAAADALAVALREVVEATARAAEMHAGGDAGVPTLTNIAGAQHAAALSKNLKRVVDARRAAAVQARHAADVSKHALQKLLMLLHATHPHLAGGEPIVPTEAELAAEAEAEVRHDEEAAVQEEEVAAAHEAAAAAHEQQESYDALRGEVSSLRQRL